MRLQPLLALVPFAAFAQWQADLESGGGDGFGIVLFFFAFFAYVHIRDAAREGPAQKWRAVATIIAVLVAASRDTIWKIERTLLMVCWA